jgi:hypothetical protein
LRRTGDDAAALNEFQRARAAFPSPKATAQIGLAYQALGRWVEAESELQESLRDRVDPWIAKNRSILQQALDAIRTHLGSLEVLGSPEGAQVSIDGRRVGVLPLAAPVRATIGTIALEVSAAGHLPLRRNVAIVSERPSRELVALTPEAVPTKPVPVATDNRPHEPSLVSNDAAPAQSDSPRSIRTGAWVAGGAAAVLLAGGVVALVIRNGKHDQLVDLRDEKGTCQQSSTDEFSGMDAQRCADLATERQTWAWVGVGALVGAGVAAATTAVLIATRPARAPRVAAVVRPGQTFMSLGWTF